MLRPRTGGELRVRNQGSGLRVCGGSNEGEIPAVSLSRAVNSCIPGTELAQAKLPEDERNVLMVALSCAISSRVTVVSASDALAAMEKISFEATIELLKARTATGGRFPRGVLASNSKLKLKSELPGSA